MAILLLFFSEIVTIIIFYHAASHFIKTIPTVALLKLF